MCEHCEWEELLEQIDDMLGQEKYEFAADTLNGIKDWVEANEHCTDGQQIAVGNIEASK